MVLMNEIYRNENIRPFMFKGFVSEELDLNKPVEEIILDCRRYLMERHDVSRSLACYSLGNRYIVNMINRFLEFNKQIRGVIDE